MASVETQLEQIHAEKMQRYDEMKAHRESFNALKTGRILYRPSHIKLDTSSDVPMTVIFVQLAEVVMPMDAVEKLQRHEKIALLVELYDKIKKAREIYSYQLSLSKQQVFQRHKVGTHYGQGRENKTVNGGISRTSSGSKHKNTANGQQKPVMHAKKRRTQKPKSKMNGSRKSLKDGMDADDTCEASIVMECRRAGVEANINTLVQMGFPRRQVVDALEEANGSVEGAVEWLTVHCI